MTSTSTHVRIEILRFMGGYALILQLGSGK